MVAVSSLLYLLPAVLAAQFASAASDATPKARGLTAAHIAQIEQYQASHRHAPAAPAPASSPKDSIASRQYNPRKRRTNSRLYRRALNSAAPAPRQVTAVDEEYGEFSFDRFYQGSGFTETDDNPSECIYHDHAAVLRRLPLPFPVAKQACRASHGRVIQVSGRLADCPANVVQPPLETTFLSTLGVPEAVQACSDYSVSNNYGAFQLYFLGSQDQWVCRAYYHDGEQSDASYFNVPNDDVLIAYGYQMSFEMIS
jgi:hypothetical protein